LYFQIKFELSRLFYSNDVTIFVNYFELLHSFGEIQGNL